MIDRFRDGRVPEADPDPDLASGPGGLAGVESAVCGLLDRAELTQALEEIWKRVRRLNRYVEETRPWDLAKDDDESDRLEQALYNLAEGLRVTTVLLSAYMPETGERMLGALGVGSREITAFGSQGGGQSTEKLPPLFPKIETAAA